MTDHNGVDRRLRILSRLSAKDRGSDVRGSDVSGARLCEVAAEVTEVTGAGIMFMANDTSAGSVCSTNTVSALMEDLQFTLGEGPCIDAYNQDRPVLEPNLVNPDTVRWTAFTGPAVEAGVRAIFGFPLHAGSVRLGALNLYCDHPGSLGDSRHADALAVADVAAQALLALQADAPAGTLARELEIVAESRWAVHQASGMVSAQLEIGVGEALARLRAYAFANNCLVSDVAAQVIDRQLRFDRLGSEER